MGKDEMNLTWCFPETTDVFVVDMMDQGEVVVFQFGGPVDDALAEMVLENSIKLHNVDFFVSHLLRIK